MNFIELIQEAGIPTQTGGAHHHVSHGWVGLDCPLCSPGSGKYRLGFSLRGNFLSCWVCGYVRLGDALQELTGWDWQRVKEALGKLEKDDRPWDLPTRGKLVLPQGLGPLEAPHEEYLEGRGFDVPSLTRLWGLQGIGRHGRPPWRVFVPVIHRGRTVSWTSRSISDRGKRYHTAAPKEEIVSAKTLLYGEDHARHAVVVVEGPADVWAVGPGAVAVLGVGFSREQVRKVSRYPRRAVCFDGDEAGRAKAKKLCELLEPFPGRTYDVVLESGADPGSASRKEIRELRREFLR